MSADARLTQAQDEAADLRRQVATLKDTLETELERMRVEVDGQLSNAKQFLLCREAGSLARVERLESEIRSLTLAYEEAIDAEEVLGAEEAAALCSDRRTCTAVAQRSPSAARSEGYPPEAGRASGDDALVGAVRDAVDALLPRLDRVFDFYTAVPASDTELLRPAMHLPQFTTMIRDSALDRGRDARSPELLWMAVFRDLPPAGGHARVTRRPGSTLLAPPVFDDGSLSQSAVAKDDLFSRGRLRSIAKADFPRALCVVFRATAHCPPDGPTASGALRVFLAEVFLPAVEGSIRRRTAARTLPTSVDSSAACPSFAGVVAAYSCDAGVQAVMQQFTPHLRRCFRAAVRCPPAVRTEDARMSIDAFVESVRQQQLLPLISRAQLKDIFAACLPLDSQSTAAAAEGHRRPAKRAAPRTEPDSVSYSTFTTAAVFCLAEVIYGGVPTLRDQYPSPCSRVSKLLVRMFVL
ncbi:hypothetical protein NESM_000394100 [Novymonas esmeraldas]|uniref:Uncharacterized protein n=1 Tax=Novymonas esmeraldas TaxID=1808958 RepID=A0AAW0ENG2_9TRYP